MARRVRFVPEGGSLVEVTVRTFQSRFLLRPGPSLNEIVGGVLGRAQTLHPVRCHFVVFMSTHWHLLLSVDDANQIARFMEYVNSNIALEVNRLYGWTRDVWDDRYHAILVSGEEAAQVDRLWYLLSHGVKEGLVAHASDWPGVHSVREILAGEPIRGFWFNRTQESAARKRGEVFDRLKYATEEAFELSPLPCWAHLNPEDYRQRVAELVEAIESEARAELARTGRAPLGVAAILRQKPDDRVGLEEEITGASVPRGDQSRAQGLLGSLRHIRGRVPRGRRPLAGGRAVGEIPDRLVSARPALRESRRRRPSLIGGVGSTLSRPYRCAPAERKEEVRLLTALKNGAESRSLQIRQIYAARQGDSARIWPTNHCAKAAS